MNWANRKKQKGFFLDKTYKSLYSHMGVWLWLHHHHWQTIFQQFCLVNSHYIIVSHNHHVHPYGKPSSSCCCCFIFFHNLSTQLYTISTLLTQINQCISSTTITHAFPYRKKAKHQTQMLAKMHTTTKSQNISQASTAPCWVSASTWPPPRTSRWWLAQTATLDIPA